MSELPFSNDATPIQYITLPNAVLTYIPNFMGQVTASGYLQTLRNPKNIAWRQEEIKMFGKLLKTPRLTAWYGDSDAIYSYSGLHLKPLAWTPALLHIRAALAQYSNTSYNSVLLNYYRHGQHSMGWHADDEKELGVNPVIASVNLGASRRFLLRRKDNKKQKHEILLQNGSLLLMQGQTQHYWQHSIPKTAKKIGERINLTFRKIIPTT